MDEPVWTCILVHTSRAVPQMTIPVTGLPPEEIARDPEVYDLPSTVYRRAVVIPRDDAGVAIYVVDQTATYDLAARPRRIHHAVRGPGMSSLVLARDAQALVDARARAAALEPAPPVARLEDERRTQGLS